MKPDFRYVATRTDLVWTALKQDFELLLDVSLGKLVLSAEWNLTRKKGLAMDGSLWYVGFVQSRLLESWSSGMF